MIPSARNERSELLPIGSERTVVNYGAGDRTRTDDLLITNQLLYQLSYAG